MVVATFNKNAKKWSLRESVVYKNRYNSRKRNTWHKNKEKYNEDSHAIVNNI